MRRIMMALALLPLGVGTLAGCGGGQRGFYPAIDCAGPVIAADFRARCGPYRGSLRD